VAYGSKGLGIKDRLERDLGRVNDGLSVVLDVTVVSVEVLRDELLLGR
jgi:hypothetical protein